MEDSRTWETQYQLTMALAELHSDRALPLLWAWSKRAKDYQTIWVAVGDALVRIEGEQALGRLLESGNASLLSGGVRALAIERVKISRALIEALLVKASEPEYEPMRFWLAAAAAGWPSSESLESFLQVSSRSGNTDLKKAARSSLRGEYLSWAIL